MIMLSLETAKVLEGRLIKVDFIDIDEVYLQNHTVNWSMMYFNCHISKDL